MRHRNAGIKLNRTSSHRKAMFRNMVTSLFKHERIRTTDAKAKEIRRWADKLVTLAKRGDLHARRQALSIIREKEVVHKLFEEAPQRFGQVNGGYTRVVKVGFRPGDAASISMVELVTPEVKKKKARRKKKAKKAAAPSTPTPQAATTEAAEKPVPEAEAVADVDADTAGDSGKDEKDTAAQEVTPEDAEVKSDAKEAAPEEGSGAEDDTAEEVNEAAADETPKKES